MKRAAWASCRAASCTTGCTYICTKTHKNTSLKITLRRFIDIPQKFNIKILNIEFLWKSVLNASALWHPRCRNQSGLLRGHPLVEPPPSGPRQFWYYSCEDYYILRKSEISAKIPADNLFKFWEGVFWKIRQFKCSVWYYDIEFGAFENRNSSW